MMKFSVLVGIFCVLSVVSGSKPGGISDEDRNAEQEIQGIVENLSKEIKAGALSTLASSGGNGANDPKIFEDASLTALTYKTQIVAGTNYFVKTKLGDHIFHVKIYRDLQGNLSLTDVVGPKKIEESIGYF